MATDISEEVRGYVLAYVRAEYGSQRNAARAWEVSQSTISRVVTGECPVPDWMLVEVRLGDPDHAPSFLKPIAPKKKFCDCKPGACKYAARECRDWIKRAFNQQNKKG